MIQDIANKIQNYYNKHGFWKTVHHFFQRIFQFKKVDFVFYEIDLKNTIRHQNRTNKFKFIKAARRDIENSPDYYDGWYNRDEALIRLDEGHVLLVVKDKNRMISFLWLEFTSVKIPHIDLSCSISDETVYISTLYTAPSHRRKGVGVKVVEQLPQYLNDKGYHKAFFVIRPDNTASIKVNKKLSGKEYQKLTYIKISFIKCYYIREWGTRQRKVYICFRQVYQKIWREYSKIGLH